MDVKDYLKDFFGQDPYYNDVIDAKGKENQAKAVDSLKTVRGDQAYKNLITKGKEIMLKAKANVV